MASFTAAFQAVSRKLHSEHQELLTRLQELDIGLDELAGDSPLVINVSAAETVRRCCRHLAELLPGHIECEESTLFETITSISPELAEFAREMRRQHQQLRARLGEFCRAIESLEAGVLLEDAMVNVKDQGKLLVCELSEHIALEESELSGIL